MSHVTREWGLFNRHIYHIWYICDMRALYIESCHDTIHVTSCYDGSHIKSWVMSRVNEVPLNRHSHVYHICYVIFGPYKASHVTIWFMSRDVTIQVMVTSRDTLRGRQCTCLFKAWWTLSLPKPVKQTVYSAAVPIKKKRKVILCGKQGTCLFKARWSLSLPQTSQANCIQCCSTHQEKWYSAVNKVYVYSERPHSHATWLMISHVTLMSHVTSCWHDLYRNRTCEWGLYIESLSIDCEWGLFQQTYAWHKEHFFWCVLQHCTGFARQVWGRLRVHRAFIYSNWFVCSVCFCSLPLRLTLLLSFLDILHCLPRAVGVPLESALKSQPSAEGL